VAATALDAAGTVTATTGPAHAVTAFSTFEVMHSGW
jgi:hypothetical protein